MPDEDVLEEVRRVREEIARECNYDVNVLFEHYRKMRPEWEAKGWKFVDRSQQRVREDPGAYGDPAGKTAES